MVCVQTRQGLLPRCQADGVHLHLAAPPSLGLLLQGFPLISISVASYLHQCERDLVHLSPSLSFHLDVFVLPFCAAASNLLEEHLYTLFALSASDWGNKGCPDVEIHE